MYSFTKTLMFSVMVVGMKTVSSLDCINPRETLTVRSSIDATNAASKISCDNGDFTINWYGDIDVENHFEPGYKTSVKFIGSGSNESVARFDGGYFLLYDPSSDPSSVGDDDSYVSSYIEDSYANSYTERTRNSSTGERFEYRKLQDEMATIVIQGMTVVNMLSSSLKEINLKIEDVVFDGGYFWFSVFDSSVDITNYVCKNSNGCLILFSSSGDIKNPLFTDNSDTSFVVADGSVIRMESPTFKSNHGHDSILGGNYSDIWASESSISFSGNSSFSDGTGEASVKIDTGSNFIFSGNVEIHNMNNTKSNFLVDNSSAYFVTLDVRDNYAHSSGVTVASGNLSIERATFKNNHHGVHGALSFQSKTEDNDFQALGIIGDMYFENNKGDIGSGAFGVSRSTVHVLGDSHFKNNTGLLGGAISVLLSSTLVFLPSSSVVFEDNRSESDGGAVHIWASYLHLLGKSTFIGNIARNGGALSVSHIASSTGRLFIENESVFHNNRASLTGGAISANGGSCYDSICVSISNTVFLNNSADVSGGAVEFSKYTDGYLVLNSTFETNYAPSGGGVHELANGYIPSSESGNYTECSFVGNKADSGGAFHSTATYTVITDSVFTVNMADIAAAIKTESSLKLDGCVFEDNIFGEGSGVISNSATIEVNDTEFRSNKVSCKNDEYSGVIDGDRYKDICISCGVCETCFVTNPETVLTCFNVPENTQSGGGVSTIKDIEVNPGFWRSSESGSIVLQCHNEDACTGGTDTGSCDAGYDGVYCATCSDGYSMSPGFVCTKCGDWGNVVISLFILCVLIFLTGCVVYLVRGLPYCQGNRRMNLYSLRIVIVVWQIVSQFSLVTNTTYPDIYERFIDIVGSIGFNLDWIMGLSCDLDTDFHSKLFVVTVCPMLLSFLAAVTYLFSDKSSDSFRRHVSFLLLVSFYVFSPVSTTLFQMFSCETLEDGREFLRADYSIQCTSDKHKALQGYSVFMLIMYVIGIPAAYSVIIYKNRLSFDDDNVASSLWNSYRPGARYFEIIELLRRVMMTGVIVFIYPDSAPQVAVTLIFAVVFIVISMTINPYAEKSSNVLSTVGHLIVFFTVYISLLYKVDLSDENSDSQDAFAYVIVIVHLLLFFSIFIELWCSIRGVKELLDPCPCESSGSSENVGMDEVLEGQKFSRCAE